MVPTAWARIRTKEGDSNRSACVRSRAPHNRANNPFCIILMRRTKVFDEITISCIFNSEFIFHDATLTCLLHVLPASKRSPKAGLIGSLNPEIFMKLKMTIQVALCAATLVAATLSPSITAADTLDDIKSRGKMVVAIDPTFQPYEFTDSSGKIIGYTPAIMEAVAKKLGVTIDYQKMAFSGIIPGLLAKSFDLEGSSLNVTAERAKRVMFTVPFSKGANAVLTRTDVTKIPAKVKIESLSGLTAAVKATTAPEKILSEFNATLTGKGLAPIKILSLDTVEQTISALTAKRADFVFDDITVLGAAMKANPGKLRSAGELGDSQWMAWATRPDDARLNKFVSEVILDMQKSGALAKLQKEHLGLVVVVPAANFVPKQ